MDASKVEKAIRAKNMDSRKKNTLIFWASLFSAFPAFTIFGTQILSFLILIIILKIFRPSFIFKISVINIIALTFIFAAIISAVYSPYQGTNNLSLKILPNYVFWGFILIVFSQYFARIRKDDVVKGISIGLGLLIVLNLMGAQRAFTFLQFPTGNGLAFLVIIFSPIAFYFLRNFSSIHLLLFAVLAIGSMVYFERRAGTVLVSLELLTFLFLKRIRVKSIIILLSIFSLVFASIQTTAVKEFVKGNSERVYLFVYEREASAQYDKSSHIRRAMVEKGLILFSMHPFTGVGLGNFIQSDVALQLDFEGGDGIRTKNLMNKSAHNSYILLLSEGGLILIVPVILLFTYIIVRLSINYNKIDDLQRAILIGFIGMCIHLYFIASIVNVFTWFYISLGASCALENGGNSRVKLA